MKSLQHVLWRGALALSLLAVGIGSGLGLPPAQAIADTGDCKLPLTGHLASPVQASPPVFVLRHEGEVAVLERDAVLGTGDPAS